MSASTMSRRDRTLLAGLVVVLLYGIAAAIFFFTVVKGNAWKKARDAYQGAARRLAAERDLVADRDLWRDRLDRIQLQMPEVGEGEIAATRWKRVVEKIAAEHSLQILGYGANSDGVETEIDCKAVEKDNRKVFELALEIQYRSSLRRLVEFLYALDTAEEGLFDVRQLEISTKKPGELTGKFTLTCAYKKGISE